LRIGVTGHRVPPKLPMQSEAPSRALLDHILATIVETARNPDSDFPGGAAANAESAFVMICGPAAERFPAKMRQPQMGSRV